MKKKQLRIWKIFLHVRLIWWAWPILTNTSLFVSEIFASCFWSEILSLLFYGGTVASLLPEAQASPQTWRGLTHRPAPRLSSPHPPLYKYTNRSQSRINGNQLGRVWQSRIFPFLCTHYYTAVILIISSLEFSRNGISMAWHELPHTEMGKSGTFRPATSHLQEQVRENHLMSYTD